MINRILKITVLGLLVSMGIASASQAQFEMNNSSAKVGVESIPFVVALRKIVPIDYDFSFESEADLGQIVSYEYKDEWTETLSSMLGGMGFSYTMDEDIIYIKSSGVAKSPVHVMKKVIPAPVVQKASVVGTVTKTKAISELVQKIEEVEQVSNSKYIWKVKKGFTLQETMKSWGEQVGWAVIWETDRDFEIQSEVSFSGSFTEAASDLIDAFAEADPPVVGTFYKNNTLVIETTSNGEVN